MTKQVWLTMILSGSVGFALGFGAFKLDIFAMGSESTNYGLMKNGRDHVLTVHGYWDDFDACMDIVKFYSTDADYEDGEWNCVPLD